MNAKTLVAFTCAMMLHLVSLGQYNRPYRIAYDTADKAYYITNRGDGSVVRMDSNYKVSKVVSGLKDPRDLIVANVAGNKGLLVVDSNRIVVFNLATFKQLVAYNVTNAVEINDIAPDPTDADVFYLSDVGADKILKGKIGPPPFYIPTYSTLVSSGINRPKGLLFNNDGELLVTSDEDSAKVYRVNLSNGKFTTVLNPGLDSLNSIVQDKEGNYYLTNWGNSKLYKTDKNFGNLTKLTLYNKPAGMIVNRETDLLLVLCYLCNKMEFHKLHYFEPASSVRSCVGDSFNVDLSIAFEGIGTYNTGNRFVVEISDSTGDFKNAAEAGQVTTISVPSNIMCFLGKGSYGNRHKFRIKSTSPEFFSTSMDITVLQAPDVKNIVFNNLTVCSGSMAKLGMKGGSQEEYRWNTSRNLSDSTVSDPVFSSVDTGVHSYTFYAVDQVNGCKDSVDVRVFVNPKLKLNNLLDTVWMCFGDTSYIGVSDRPFTFAWTPADALLDSTVSNPRFKDTVSRWCHVEMKDTSVGCTGSDSVYVRVTPLPEIKLDWRYTKLCAGDSVQLTVETDSLNAVVWSPNNHLDDPRGREPIFRSTDSYGVFEYQVDVSTGGGCHSADRLKLSNNEPPRNVVIDSMQLQTDDVGLAAKINGSMPSGLTGELYLMNANRDSSWFGRSFDTMNEWGYVDFSLLFGNYPYGFITISTDSGCSWTSDTMEFEIVLGISDLESVGVRIFPSPANDRIVISDQGQKVDVVSLHELSGKQLKSLRMNDLSQQELGVADIPDGLYMIHVTTHSGSQYAKRLVILHR